VAHASRAGAGSAAGTGGRTTPTTGWYPEPHRSAAPVVGPYRRIRRPHGIDGDPPAHHRATASRRPAHPPATAGRCPGPAGRAEGTQAHVPHRERDRPGDHPPAPGQRPHLLRRAQPRDRDPGVDRAPPHGSPPAAGGDRVRDARRAGQARLRPARDDRSQGRASTPRGHRRPPARDERGHLRGVPDRELRRDGPRRRPLPGGPGDLPHRAPGADRGHPFDRDVRDAVHPQADDQLGPARAGRRGRARLRPRRRGRRRRRPGRARRRPRDGRPPPDRL
ncbi:MAG: hypothetical protein AVDCRST_MAG49-4471, partial [uncultured Thermomicrobiales bacterium]